ncbi:hypothetical protein TrLO_g10399 [Triparma laevis f. longispina]|uniref:PTM/DIR17-like Tudor domain-containing protein n=1 Tax=Triparma laevis f. longispina TaxID=1714387 RepID=A0A9W7AZE9_9STRA|nr:hypothetical protein TrLO_g10399 [Triparma laevis f. longispina]
MHVPVLRSRQTPPGRGSKSRWEAFIKTASTCPSFTLLSKYFAAFSLDESNLAKRSRNLWRAFLEGGGGIYQRGTELGAMDLYLRPIRKARLLQGWLGEYKTATASTVAERQRQEEDEEDVKFEIKREIKAEAQVRTNNARGMRVAKFFHGIAYPGVVKGLNDDDKEPWWNIVYDDGDKEDLNETELQLGLKLHREKFGGETKRRLF